MCLSFLITYAGNIRRSSHNRKPWQSRFGGEQRLIYFACSGKVFFHEL